MSFEAPEGRHLAELNVARAVDEKGSPQLADFVSALDRVNAIAERSPGFVWRLTGEGGDATDVRANDDPRFIVNLSVWETAQDLEHFVWNTVHRKIYQKKSKWFEPMAEAHFVMWRVDIGHRPTIDEAMARLTHLQTHGPTAEAFGWESLPNIKLWMTQRCA